MKRCFRHIEAASVLCALLTLTLRQDTRFKMLEKDAWEILNPMYLEVSFKVTLLKIQDSGYIYIY